MVNFSNILSFSNLSYFILCYVLTNVKWADIKLGQLKKIRMEIISVEEANSWKEKANFSQI